VNKTKKLNQPSNNEKLKPNKNKPKPNLKKQRSENTKPSPKNKTKPALKENQSQNNKLKLDTILEKKQAIRKTSPKQKPNQ